MSETAKQDSLNLDKEKVLESLRRLKEQNILKVISCFKQGDNTLYMVDEAYFLIRNFTDEQRKDLWTVTVALNEGIILYNELT